MTVNKMEDIDSFTNPVNSFTTPRLVKRIDGLNDGKKLRLTMFLTNT